MLPSASSPYIHTASRAALPQRSFLRCYVAGGPRRTSQPLRAWPFIAITLLGSVTYVYMVRGRVGNAPTNRSNTAGPFQQIGPRTTDK